MIIRAVTTVLIWFGLFGVFVTMSSNMAIFPPSIIWQIFSAIILLVMALGTTAASMAIWHKGTEGETVASTNAHHAKLKRNQQDRVKRLLESLSDDELEALETTQFGNDGELLSMEQLLKQQKSLRK